MPENLNQLRGRPVYIDLIRAVAMVGVIMLHASGQWIVDSQEMEQMEPLELVRWYTVDIYQSMAVTSVPLFLMLTGALLLEPQKEESLRAFFKKRWDRIGLPFLFWSAAYFAWVFLVQNLPFAWIVIVQGMLIGPYTHFWYIYVLIGLYLLTPLLRMLIASANTMAMKYLIVLWVFGAVAMPFLGFLTIFQLHDSIFTITGYVGYFALGTYLATVQMKRSTVSFLMVLGIALTALGTYVLAVTVGGTEMYFFQEYLSPTVVLTSVMLFLLLLTIKPPAVQKDAVVSKFNKLVKLISHNTLSIYFIHVMILEALKNGYFGFAINRNTIDPIIEVPLLTVIVLFVSLAIVLLLKKIPYFNRLIGCAPKHLTRGKTVK